MGVCKSENGRPAFGRCDNLSPEPEGLLAGTSSKEGDD